MSTYVKPSYCWPLPPRAVSGITDSAIGCDVNSSSKFDVSVADLTFGLNEGSSSRASSFAQSIGANHACSRSSKGRRGPSPRPTYSPPAP